MKLQRAKGLATRMPVQLELNFSSGGPRPDAGAKAGYYRNGHRQRPTNDNDPFTDARGYIKPCGSSRWEYPK